MTLPMTAVGCPCRIVPKGVIENLNFYLENPG
jgi:hypothetical protein